MSDFGSQLKKLRTNNKITQKELAKILGLAQTTIANYENNSRFPNQKTLLDIAEYFKVTLDYLITGKKREVKLEKEKSTNLISLITKDPYFKNNELAKEYFIHLLNSQKKEAKNLILAQLKSPDDKKNKILKIYQDIFKSVLYKIGDLWVQGKIGIEKERYISNTTLEIMSVLKNEFAEINPKGYTILGLASYQEKHNIGLKMIMDLFQLEGWNSIYYGNNLPLKSILKAISFHNPDVVAFSITAEENINSLIKTINAIRNIYDENELKIIIGGYAARSLEERIKNIDIKIITKDIDQIIKIALDLVNN
ncbi:MAG: helix-turn-helix domain-containing protein [Halanaerobium sp.]